MSCCFIIGTEKDYKDRLSEIKLKLQRTFNHMCVICYDGHDFNNTVNLAINDISEFCDVAYYMRGWREDPVCRFLNQYVKLTGMEYMKEPSPSRNYSKTFTTEDDYVMTKTHTPEFVRDVVELYNSGLSTVAIARKYGMHQKTIWRIVDRNRHKITRDDL